jgi:hypothetical protein
VRGAQALGAEEEKKGLDEEILVARPCSSSCVDDGVGWGVARGFKISR